MPLLLHAIARADPGGAVEAGVRGQPCLCLATGSLAAWATLLPDSTARFDRADLLAHHAIVSRLDTLFGGVLPARFPSWLTDEDALLHELERRQADFVDGLDRVRGRVEIAVTATWTVAPDLESAPAPAPAPAPATPGRTYLLRRQHTFADQDKRRERARLLAEQTDRLVGDDLVDVRHQVCPSATVALSSAVLVPRERAAAIKGRLLREEHDVRILVNGPWPAYTFVTVV